MPAFRSQTASSMKKAAHETDRSTLDNLEQIENVGIATAEDLRAIGVAKPQQLIGSDPWRLYQELCAKTKSLHDPCVLDVFMAAVDFMNGHPPKKWWEFTSLRKARYGEDLKRFSI